MGTTPFLAGEWHKFSPDAHSGPHTLFFGAEVFHVFFLITLNHYKSKKMRFVLGTKIGWEWWA